MAFPSIATTITFAGDGNQGLQVGHNSGSIETHIYAPERPETPPQPSCCVPFRRDPDFIDRATLLNQIAERCSAPASRVALVGLGGVGKSQLAIEHCYRTAERSPETWVLWAHASNPARLEQSFREIAELVKVRGRKEPQADVFKLVHDWLRDEKNGPWLLVVDNADNASVLSAPADNSQKSQAENNGSADNSVGALQQHLSRYLPPSRHGSVLVTSRTRQAAMQLVEDRDIIPIKPMNNAAANALLRTKLGDESKMSDSDNDITELAATLDHMPLALIQAAAYIRQRALRCSVQQYLEQYRQSDSSATILLNQGAGHLRRDEAASNAILTSWQISFDHVRGSRKSTADLLSLMSFFDRQGIPEALLRNRDGTANNNDDNSFKDDLDTLRDYSFITVTRDAKTFEMHSLVQLAMRKWLGNQNQLDKWREQFISNLCAELPTGGHANWEKCQALFPHAKAALRQRPRSQKSLEEWALLLYKAAWYAWHQGKAGEAEQMSTVSMEVRSEVLGEESLETSESIGMVGLAKLLGGKYKEAEEMLRQTLATIEKVLGREHPLTLTSVRGLAHVLVQRGCYKESLALYNRACAGYSVVLGEDHPTTRACRQLRSKTVASQEQGRVGLYRAKLDNGTSTRRSKTSMSSRRLAKLKMRSSKHKRE